MGVPGTSSNMPGASATATRAGDETQASKSENGSYAVNRSVRRTVHPGGRIRRVTAAVVVDDAVEYKAEGNQQKAVHRKRTPEEMKQIEDLARAAIGFDATRGDVLAVQNAAFVSTPEPEPVAPGRLQKVQRVANDWSGMLRYVVLGFTFLILYLLVIRPVKKHFISVLKQLPRRAVAGQEAALEPGIVGGIAEGADVRRAQVLKKQLIDKVTQQPAVASRLVQGWIGDGGSR
jgi:flagellar M-ring protein FliF